MSYNNEEFCNGYDDELMCCIDPECEDCEDEHRTFYEEYVYLCEHSSPRVAKEDILSYEDYVKTGAGNGLMQLCINEGK